MTYASRAVALAVYLLTPGAATASPDLDVGELSAGELTGEVNAFVGDQAWTVRPELEFGLSDVLGLEIQTAIADEPGARPKLTDLSAQLMMSLSPEHRLGIAAEVSYALDQKEAGGEVFLFASRDAGPWTLDINLGVEREGGDAAGVYAWRLERDFTSHWSAGLAGGGETPLHGTEHEHVAGPTLALKLSAIELRVGWFFGSGAANLAHIGLERAF